MRRLRLSHIWVAVAALVLVCGLLFIYRRSLPPQVPLWYSRPWGQDQLENPYWLWLVPVLIAVMAAAGAAGSKWLERDQLLAQLWLSSAVVVELILALSAVRIIWLVVF